MRRRAASTAGRNGGAGLAVSAAFHLLLFLLLGLALRYNPVFPVAPTLEVRLVTLSPTHVEAKRPPPRVLPAQPAAPPLAPHIPLTTAPPAPAFVAPAPVLPRAQPGAEALRRGMRLMLGCAHPDDFDLSPSEREACREMTERTQAAAPPYPPGAWHPDAKTEQAYRRALRRDAAEAAYQGSTSPDDYPGLHCAFGRDCEPDAPTPRAEPGHDDCPWAWCNMVGR